MLKAQYLLITIGICLLVGLGWLGLRLVGSGKPDMVVTLPAPAANVAPATAPPTATPPPAPGYNLPPMVAPTAMPSTLPAVVNIAVNDIAPPPFIPTVNEHWAEADLTKAEVRLYQGQASQAVFQISYGRGDTANTTTYAGLFTVYVKDASLHQSVVRGEYIRYWVGFDPKWANGFHSVIMDSSGRVIDARLGQPISSGCIRTTVSDAAAIFAWLRVGAQVWVHY